MSLGVIQKPKILIYGSGAIGSIFGGKLAFSGIDITMLARGNRLKELKENGIIIENAISGVREQVGVSVIKELKEDDIYDYIIVAVQNTQIDSILPILSKNKSLNIVFIVNNPCGYKKYIDSVGYERILIGFPSAGGERNNGIVKYYIGKGIAKLFQSTTFGELSGEKTERLMKLLHIFRKAGFSPSINRNMNDWQKIHVAVVVSIGEALYKFDSNNYKLAKSPETLKVMIMSIRERFELLKQRGVRINPWKLNFFYLPTFLLVPIFSIVMNTKIAEFAMAKHTIVAKDEMLVLEKLLLEILNNKE
ncbi:ketopantoate reductase family protein [Clostridium sp. UBA1652]|uniref:ketopantoate reductase family protein n=1 Tax=Clostridium sp. UBA1652 TaxID=1946348 RepID=UPI0025809DC1|nr:2-dehydropantoate 2-reductase N-terminal domain-containing protein [Clostridium sp. UBA1652]